MSINVEYINPFLMAASNIIKDICQIEMKIGKPYIKSTEFAEDSVVIDYGKCGYDSFDKGSCSRYNTTDSLQGKYQICAVFCKKYMCSVKRR